MVKCWLKAEFVPKFQVSRVEHSAKRPFGSRLLVRKYIIGAEYV